MTKRMRKYLRKPSKSSSKATTSRTNWRALYRRAVSAVEHLDPDEYPKVKYLLAGERKPEKTLRKLSIICDAGIKREFGSLT